MEEFYLRLLLALQKLDIVDNQAVNIAVFLAEGLSCFVLDGIDDFVGEFFTGGVEYGGLPNPHFLRDLLR